MHVHYDIPGIMGQVIEFFLVGIIAGYLVIAWQFWRARAVARAGNAIRVEAEEAAQAVTYLMVIFVFCAICGYLPRLFPVGDLFMFVTHSVLFFATWAYVLSRQASAIALALADG